MLIHASRALKLTVTIIVLVIIVPLVSPCSRHSVVLLPILPDWRPQIKQNILSSCRLKEDIQLLPVRQLEGRSSSRLHCQCHCR